MVADASSEAGFAGAEVQLGTTYGAVGSLGETVVEGPVLAEGNLFVLFANVEPTDAARVEVVVDGATCPGREALPVVAGAASYVRYVCE